MAEQSYLFDFTRTDDFFEQFNLKFKVSDMYKVTGYNENTQEYSYAQGTGGDNFKLYVFHKGGANISEYLDTTASYSKLKSSLLVEGTYMEKDIGLDWYNRGNGEYTVELHGDATFEIGEENSVQLRAILLCCGDYVMGYSINMKPFSVTNQLVFDDDIIFWDITRFKE